MFRPLCLVIIACASACHHKWKSQSLPVLRVVSPWFAANVNGTLVVDLRRAEGKHAGLMLKDSSGAIAGKGDCKLTYDGARWRPELQCEVPSLNAGAYSLFLSGDSACGNTSYKAVDDSNVTIVESARVASVTPTHGPATSQTKIALQGTNFGGEHMFCHFAFFAGPGAKKDGSGNPMGCSMTKASYGAEFVNSTTAICTTPKWPGPMNAAGAICSPNMLVQLTNDGLVHSPEQVFFTFDKENRLII